MYTSDAANSYNITKDVDQLMLATSAFKLSEITSVFRFHVVNTNKNTL